jgi:hypothetical protein
MKIDKRLSEEFGTDLPVPTPWWKTWLLWHWTTERLIEASFGNAINAMIYTALLGVGAWVGQWVASAPYWFLGISACILLCLVVIFGLVLLASAVDMPGDDGSYPGS